MIIALWVVVVVLAATNLTTFLIARQGLNSVPTALERSAENLRSEERTELANLREELTISVDKFRKDIESALHQEVTKLEAKMTHLEAEATAEGLEARIVQLSEQFAEHLKGYQHV